MRSMLLSVALAVGALGLMPAKPAQARPDELVGPSITNENTMPVAYWGGRGFYRGYYPGFYGGYRPYGGFYRGYYPYGGGLYRGYGGFNRRFYYGGGMYPYGGFGGFGGFGAWPYYGGYYW